MTRFKQRLIRMARNIDFGRVLVLVFIYLYRILQYFSLNSQNNCCLNLATPNEKDSTVQ